MKVTDIISEDHLDEAPVGMASRALNKVGRYLGSRVSSAKLDVADDANNLKKDLKAWMAGSGLNKNLTVADFKNFLEKKGLDSDKVDDLFSQMRQGPGGSYRTGAMSNKEIDKILLKVVQNAFRGQDDFGNKSRYAKNQSKKTQDSDQIKQMVDQLRAAGYNVSKKPTKTAD